MGDHEGADELEQDCVPESMGRFVHASTRVGAFAVCVRQISISYSSQVAGRSHSPPLPVTVIPGQHRSRYPLDIIAKRYMYLSTRYGVDFRIALVRMCVQQCALKTELILEHPTGCRNRRERFL